MPVENPVKAALWANNTHAGPGAGGYRGHLQGEGQGKHHPARRFHRDADRRRDRARSTLSLADSLILAVAGRLRSPAVSRDRYWHWLEDKGLIAVPVRSF